MKKYVIIGAVLFLFLCGCNNTSNERIVHEATLVATPDSTKEAIKATESTPTIAVTQPAKELEDKDFVVVTDYINTAVVDLKYATNDNFTGQQIYDFNSPWLRYGTVKKLKQVAQELAQQGYYIKIWDAFRPPAAQHKLWEIYPDPTYVANPNNGFSSHSRGNTVDITLVLADGSPVIMPTGFDDFSKLADRDYSDCEEVAAKNALLLENAMKKYGFKAYFGEWWHFTDVDTYEVEHIFIPTQ